MFCGLSSFRYFFLTHGKTALGKIGGMTPATEKTKRQTAADRAIRRLFVAVDRAIKATDEARKARDEIVRLSREREAAE